MTLKRLGRCAFAWGRWVTGRGAALDLHGLGPATLKKIVNQATLGRLLMEFTNSRGMGGFTGPPY
eukprot:8560559-Pyramimonas_sp.AAC.1